MAFVLPRSVVYTLQPLPRFQPRAWAFKETMWMSYPVTIRSVVVFFLDAMKTVELERYALKKKFSNDDLYYLRCGWGIFHFKSHRSCALITRGNESEGTNRTPLPAYLNVLTLISWGFFFSSFSLLPLMFPQNAHRFRLHCSHAQVLAREKHSQWAGHRGAPL